MEESIKKEKICPFKSKCANCQLLVVLYMQGKPVERCAFAWIPGIMAESNAILQSGIARQEREVIDSGNKDGG